MGREGRETSNEQGRVHFPSFSSAFLMHKNNSASSFLCVCLCGVSENNKNKNKRKK